MPHDISDLCNTHLGNYILLKLLGKTGMSAVYSGKKRATEEVVAVKILLPEAFGSRSADKRRIRFEREAITGANLHHEFIVPILDYFTPENLACIVMPYYPDGTLGKLLDVKNHLSLDETARYIKQIAPALDYAHSQKVVHRDIKPDNLLLDGHDHLMLSDFGIARITDNPNWLTLTTRSDMIIGSIPYMSPEACRGERVDLRTDIYALGMVIYEMLHGSLPFNDDDTTNSIIEWHKTSYLPPLHQEHPEIPSSVDRVLRQATEKRRFRRFSSAQELAEAFASSILSHSPYDAATEIDQDFFSVRNRVVLSNVPAKRYAGAFVAQPARRHAAFPQARHYSGFMSKLNAIWLFLIGMLLAFLVGGSIFLFTRPSSAPSFGVVTNQINTGSDIQQARASVQAYYSNWNKGNYQAAYSLLSPDYQKNHSYKQEYVNYEQVRYSCYLLNDAKTLNNNIIQIDVTVNQIRNNPSGSGTVIYAYTLSFIAQKIQGQWRLTADNVQLISMQGTCKP